jgi:hypothetical protein
MRGSEGGDLGLLQLSGMLLREFRRGLPVFRRHVLHLLSLVSPACLLGLLFAAEDEGRTFCGNVLNLSDYTVSHSRISS